MAHGVAPGRARWIGRGVLLFCVVLAGLCWYLGMRRWTSLAFQFVLWAVWLALTGTFVCAVSAAWAASRERAASWARYFVGPLLSAMILVFLYGAAQVVFWWLGHAESARRLHTGPHAAAESFVFDSALGVAPLENTASGARLVADGNVVFDYTYETDAYRRRIVPAVREATAPHRRALLLFGGSFAFGEGVNDEETLANHLAQSLPDTRVYNYAFSGYGPSQALALLESGRLKDQVPETDVAALFVFIPNHVRRVIGSYSVIPWSRHAPYYVLDDTGRPVRRGSFRNGRPGLTQWYEFLQGDYVLKYFHLDFPLRLRPRHFQLTAAILKSSAETLESQFESSAFHVVIHPDAPESAFPGARFVPYLENAEVAVIDLSALLGENLAPYYFHPHDSHPRPETHRRVASALAAEPLFSGSAP